MVKFLDRAKRSERVVAIMRTLCAQPGRLFTLRDFVEQFGCAKSTLSEDVAVVRGVLSRYGMGMVETINGASGGVRFLPFYSDEADRTFVQHICHELQQPERILPGGFLYTVDLFSEPRVVGRIGEIFAKHFYELEPDVVVTVESMGVPIGLMVAQALGKPLVTARRDNKATEGSTVTINYMSASSRQMQSMSLSRRSLLPGQKALLVDDFMKGGGTAKGLTDLMTEFDVEVVGMGVILSTSTPDKKRIAEYSPLMVLEDVDEDAGSVKIGPAAWL